MIDASRLIETAESGIGSWESEGISHQMGGKGSGREGGREGGRGRWAVFQYFISHVAVDSHFAHPFKFPPPGCSIWRQAALASTRNGRWRPSEQSPIEFNWLDYH